MAPPFRDVLPRIEWDEVSYENAIIVSSVTAGLDDNYLAQGWSLVENPTGLTTIHFLPGHPWLDGHILFGSGTYDGYAEKTFTGLTPGTLSGWHLQSVWSLDTGPGELFMELVGVTTDRLVLPNGTFTFWTIDPSLSPLVVKNYFTTIVPPSGTVKIRVGGQNYAGSCNVHAQFSSLEAVDLSCEPTVTSYRLDFPYPLEDVRSYRRPRPSSSRVRLPSRFRSAWLIGHDGVLEAESRWIPALSDLALPLNDGWEDRDDAGTVRAGWSRFMRHALSGGSFTFYPDKDDDGTSYPCQWLDRGRGKPELEEDMERFVPFGIRTTNGALIEGYSQ